jgi:serpin B
MKKTVALLSTLSVVFLFSCDENSNNNGNLPEPIRIQLSEAEAQMTKSGNTSAMNFFSVVHELEEGAENIILSPMSLNMALAMLLNGANGETGQSIQQIMGAGDYSPAEVNGYFKKLRETFAKTDPSTQLALANSIWYRLNLQVKPDFINTNYAWYNAEIKEIDFTNSQTPAIINQWCSNHTNGLIKEMIKSIPENAVMYLLNALYFKGKWADGCGFNQSETKDDVFTKEDDSELTVKMMRQNNILGYYKDDYLSLTSLSYGNQAFNMVFVLPNSGVSFDNLAAQLKQEDYWKQCLTSMTAYDVDLYIPRFKINYEIRMNDALKQLGMEIAFSGNADFSGISDTPSCISEVKQKAFIEVNEVGTEAAVVTQVGMDLAAAGPPPEPEKVTFRADRPFLFAIQENSTGVLLFLGKIGNPNE